MYGPDVKASLTIEEISELCVARDAFHRMQNNPVDKNVMADELETMRTLFTKSIALKSPARKGSVLTQEMLVPKKPGTGISYEDRDQIIGRALIRDVSHDRLLTWQDLDPENA